MHVQAYKPLDEGEYLALEARSPVRHEYIAGEVFAMTGASIRHNIIALNIATALRTHLRGTPCRALMEGVKLYLKEERSYFYPDVMVTCEPRLLELDAQVQVVDSPVLIVEVLSPSTEGIDRREKLRAYRTLPGLKEYAMVSQDECTSNSTAAAATSAGTSSPSSRVTQSNWQAWSCSYRSPTSISRPG